MKLVLVADTHMAKKEVELPSRLLEELPSADLIIHAGDWNIPEIYERLKTFAPVHGVYGNVDGKEIQELMPDKQIIEIKGFKVGIVHGHGEKKTTEKRAIEAFVEDHVDIIVFGHSHIPLLRYFKKQLLFNPGSPTAKRKLPYYSFGIITFNEESFDAKHVFYQ